MVVDTSLYDLLSVPPTATPSELKTAYRKASLANHPDKNPQDPEGASARFQEIGSAYETLSDPQKREEYDTYGLEGLRGAAGGGGMGPDMDDMFASMFGMGGGMGGMGGMPRRQRQRGSDSLIKYSVTLSDLYNGKVAHFNLSKNVLCPTCDGSGGRPGCKPQKCVKCQGEGRTRVLRNMGNGMISQSFAACPDCNGVGEKIKDKERCKKCKGEKVVKAKAKLDLNIERGMTHGQRIVFKGENDQEPGVPQPGDIIFQLDLQPHPTFTLEGLDLLCTVHLTLSEALMGFDRAVLSHLDGRQLRISRARGQVTKPGQLQKVVGEGMMRQGDRGERGNLFIRWEVDFPESGWLADVDSLKLASLLPPKRPDLPAAPGVEVDEIQPESASLEEFGENQPAGKDGEDGWEDEEDGFGGGAGGGGAQCAPQ